MGELKKGGGGAIFFNAFFNHGGGTENWGAGTFSARFTRRKGVNGEGKLLLNIPSIFCPKSGNLSRFFWTGHTGRSVLTSSQAGSRIELGSYRGNEYGNQTHVQHQHRALYLLQHVHEVLLKITNLYPLIE